MTVCPLSPLDSHPIFIGIAPFDADLGLVNFFDNGGVFLCMGGSGSESLIAALGAPGGPSFHAFGERSLCELPRLPEGGTLAVHYYEDQSDGGEKEGQIRFVVGDEFGRGINFERPMLRKRIKPGKWRPCMLLCVPGTKVRVQQMF